MKGGMPTGLALLALVLALAPGAPAHGDASAPATMPPAPAATPERFYNEGLEHQKKGDFVRAAQAYHAAVRLRDRFPEAWNGLGFALRQQGSTPTP